MDRGKVKEAAVLDFELDELEHRIRMCKEDGTPVTSCNLLKYLSPVAQATVREAIMYEADKDRVGLERKIAEL